VFILVYKEVAQVKRCPRVKFYDCELGTEKIYKEVVVSHYEAQCLHLPEIAVRRAEMFKIHCTVKFQRVQLGLGRTRDTVSLLRFSSWIVRRLLYGVL